MAKQPADEFRDIHFPAAGIDRSLGFWRQPNRPTGSRGQYRRTCYDAVNVRAYDPTTNRNRGGSRTGITRFLDAKVAGETFVVQDLSTITRTTGVPVQQSQSGRVVSLVAVSEGRLFYVNAGDDTWTEATNNTGETPPLNFTGIMFASPNQQKLWYVDGINRCVFTPADGTIGNWVTTAGEFPADDEGNLPRLVETWRGRNLVSGLLGDPQNIFGTAVDDPNNFDYAPESPSATDAFALNLSGGLGLIGDVVMAMIPYTDDLLVVGCNSSIRIIRGDPLAGGQVDTVTTAVGMAFGRPWTVDPLGNVYFFSNRCGIYTMIPGQQPQRISQGIESLLQDIDTGANAIRMLWNDRGQSLHVFVTPTEEPAPATHFVYEARTGAWFKDEFGNDDFNPLCCCVFDGNTARDRVPLIGSWDGYVRALSVDATDDDGVPIESSVTIGPFVTKNFDDLTIRDIQAVLGKNSGEVTYEILVGDSPEDALASEPFDSGTWEAGRNLDSYVQASGHASYIRIGGLNPWQIESLRARIDARGPIRARQQ